MLFKQRFWPALADGTVTLAFRRWKRPTVRAGGTLITPAGVLAIDTLTAVDEADITDDDAVRAGYASSAVLVAELGDRDGQWYRIAFHRVGDDPRRARREEASLSAADVDALGRRLDRLDRASTHGPWTLAVLQLIAERPGVRAGDLADEMGRERLAFKSDVRKLKGLGLTESLVVGYRISPRGQAWLDHVGNETAPGR